MTPRNLDKAQVLAHLAQSKNKLKTAQHFMISRDTLDHRLKGWGEFENYRFYGGRPKAQSLVNENCPIFRKGERVIWTPAHARRGFFGRPEAYAPVKCEVLSGPSNGDLYTVRPIGRSERSKSNNVKSKFLKTIEKENT